jgi:hypothetical protein
VVGEEEGNEMSDTPRTGEAQFGTGRVSVDFARQLERELNAANAIIRQQQLLDEENLRLQERIKRLEEAGDAMVSHAKALGMDGTGLVQRWNKAKEAKP